MHHLDQLFIFLTAALAIVPIANRLGLGTVLGYLIAGIVIGPGMMGLISDVEAILSFSEFGVVLLLFIIGLELEPRRLWLMRRTVFGIGGAQVCFTTLAFALFSQFVFQMTALQSFVIGLGLALSSTAFVMATLTEGKQLTTTHGQTTFGILLFQDLAVIPVLALLPLMAQGKLDLSQNNVVISGAKIAGVAILLILVGRFLIRPVFKMVALTKSHELFTAASLLVVVGTGLLMERIGLSMSLGAFAAGVLLANSEYRHEMEANIEPFRGLLMGLFFMAVGMSTQIHMLVDDPLLIIGLLIAFILVKSLVLWGIAMMASIGRGNALCVAMNLAVGGEFAFVLYGAAVQYGIFESQLKELLIVVISLSMMVSPFLLAIKNYINSHRHSTEPERAFDKIEESTSPVIIAGFGRFGQVVARLLRTQKIGYTALEASARQVDFVRKFGGKLYYGDASNYELLKSAKADQAKIFVVAISDQAASIRTIRTIKMHFPHLTIYARARNRTHAFALLDEGVTNIYRETFLSSLEAGEHVLSDMGIPADRIEIISERFRRYDEGTILRQHASQLHTDEKKLQEDAKRNQNVLEELMEMDETVVGTPEFVG